MVILGGGPAGLTAAWELGQGGAKVLLVEREASTGGLCRTHERAGFRFDMGGHRFITSDRELLDRVVALAGQDLLLAERSSEVALLGRRFKYPLELPDLVRNLPPGLAARALLSFLRSRLGRRRDPENFEEWACDRFGKVLYDLFLGPYTEKVWGVAPRELSTEWAKQRISLLDLKDLVRSLWSHHKALKPRTCARTFLYPRLGMGQLFQRVTEAALRGGATVLTQTAPCGWEMSGRRLAALHLRGPHGTHKVVAEQFLSTIPLPRLLQLLPGTPPPGPLIDQLKFRPVRFLNLALAKHQALPTTWRYVGERRFRAGRLQEPRRRSPLMAPPGQSSLMVEIPHAPGDDIDLMSDPELLSHITPELDELGVPLRSDLLFAFSVRAPEAYPVHLRGTEQLREQAFAHLSPFENLRSFGRQGSFRFVFSDAAMRMGLEAARGILQGRPPENHELAQVASARQLLEVGSLVDIATLSA